MTGALLGALAAVVMLGARELVVRLTDWMGRHVAAVTAAEAAANATLAKKHAIHAQGGPA